MLIPITIYNHFKENKILSMSLQINIPMFRSMVKNSIYLMVVSQILFPIRDFVC